MYVRAYIYVAYHDIVAACIGREERHHSGHTQLARVLCNQRIGFVVHTAGLNTHTRVVKDLGVVAVGVLAAEVPDGKERIPVDVLTYAGQIYVCGKARER